jgi:inner membrane protein
MSDSDTPSRPEGGRFDLTRLPQRSFGLKLILVCVLALLMAIPAGLVWLLSYSRSTDAGVAIAEVIAMRGGPQELMGPVIVVPFAHDITTTNTAGGSPVVLSTTRGRIVLYADTGAATSELTTELRGRGLHDVPVYSARTAFTAQFDPSHVAAEAPSGARINWSDARIYMSLGELRTVRDASITLAGRPVELAPIEGDTEGLYGEKPGQRSLVGGSAPWLAAAAAQPFSAEAQLTVTGAERISLAAFAKDTTIKLGGNWGSPRFDGGVLPDSRTVSRNRFDAQWRIPFLARGAPGAGQDLAFATVINGSPGASLLDLGNPYQSVERALKYSPLFIGLVFLTYFLFETTSGIRAHPAQYVLVGLAQTVFYMLLLSISEVAGFTPGFAIAATCTVLALSLYAGSVFASRAAMLKALGVFSITYALIYVLLRMEDYALLVGSIASFLAIAGTMWMTRKLDWYGVGRSTAPPEREPAM